MHRALDLSANKILYEEPLFIFSRSLLLKRSTMSTQSQNAFKTKVAYKNAKAICNQKKYLEGINSNNKCVGLNFLLFKFTVTCYKTEKCFFKEN